jgi:hypothetical protein
MCFEPTALAWFQALDRDVPLLDTSSKTATEVMKEALYLAKNTCFAKLPNKNMVSGSH